MRHIRVKSSSIYLVVSRAAAASRFTVIKQLNHICDDLCGNSLHKWVYILACVFRRSNRLMRLVLLCGVCILYIFRPTPEIHKSLQFLWQGWEHQSLYASFLARAINAPYNISQTNHILLLYMMHHSTLYGQLVNVVLRLTDHHAHQRVQLQQIVKSDLHAMTIKS